MIAYPRFTKLIVSHYMTAFPEISGRVRVRYHNLEDDVMIKSIFNSGKSKGLVGMKIPDWMITDEMKLIENYQLYAEVFGVDVPTTQSQPIKSTQGTHRTPSAPTTPNPEIAEGESSAPQRSTVIRLHTLQVSLAEQKICEELEAKQNVEKVKEHLMAKEIEKLVEGSENVEENVESDKESPKVEKIADISQPVNIIEEEEESVKDDYELRRREEGKHVEMIRNTPSPRTIRSPRIPTNFVSLDTEKLQELTKTDTILSSSTPSSSSSKLSATNRLFSLFKSKSGRFKRYKSFFDELQRKYSYLFGHLTTKFMPRRKFNALARHLQDIMMESLPKMDDPHDDAHPEGENSAKRQKTSEHGTFLFGESSSGQDYESQPGPSMSSNQDQSDDFDFWTNSYATDYDVLSNEKVSQELVDEMSQTVDEAKLCKVVNEIRKEIIVPPYQPKPTLVIQSCQRDPKAPALSLFPAVRFPNNDIEERTSGWVTKCAKKFNAYARYGFKHYKNSHTYWELGHEHKFITEIIARRANGCIVSITESDYKNLNKNDIEDMYLLIINHKVDDYDETGLLWSLLVVIKSTVIWERVHDFQLVYGIIYKNNKKEKRVMRHQEVHKFCDATLKRVLEGLKSYNNNVKYGYVTHNLSKEDVEYLQLFAE
ncbi:hypothetical protein Tco_1419152 [Tanacetum coccineum]